jgi:hypothetical protein
MSIGDIIGGFNHRRIEYRKEGMHGTARVIYIMIGLKNNHV